MATTVYETVDIELMDGTQLKMRPLKISLLREFMSTFEKLAEASESNDQSMDVLIECVQVAMKQYSPELAGDKAALEDVLDLPMVYKVIEAASGIKFDDSGNVSRVGTPGKI